MAEKLTVRDLKKLMGRANYREFVDSILTESISTETETVKEKIGVLEAIIKSFKEGSILNDSKIKIELIGTEAKTYREGHGFIAKVSLDLGEDIILRSKIKYSTRENELDTLSEVENILAQKGFKNVVRPLKRFDKRLMASMFTTGNDMAKIFYKLPEEQRVGLLKDTVDTLIEITDKVKERDFIPSRMKRLVGKRQIIKKYDAQKIFFEKYLDNCFALPLNQEKRNLLSDFYKDINILLQNDDPGLIHLDLHTNNIIVNTREAEDDVLRYTSFKIGDWDPSAIGSMHLPLNRLLLSTDSFNVRREEKIYNHAFDRISKKRKITRPYFDALAKITRIQGDLNLAASADKYYNVLKSLGEKREIIKEISSYYFTRGLNTLFSEMQELQSKDFNNSALFEVYQRIRSKSNEFATTLRGLVEINNFSKVPSSEARKSFGMRYLTEDEFQDIEGKLNPDRDAWGKIISPLLKEKAEIEGFTEEANKVVAKRQKERGLKRIVQGAVGAIVVAGTVNGVNTLVKKIEVLSHPEITYTNPDDVEYGYASGYFLRYPDESGEKEIKDKLRSEALERNITKRKSEVPNAHKLDLEVRAYEPIVAEFARKYGFGDQDLILALLSNLSSNGFKEVCKKNKECTEGLLVSEFDKDTLQDYFVLKYERKKEDKNWEPEEIEQLVKSFKTRIERTGKVEYALASFVVGVHGLINPLAKKTSNECLFYDSQALNKIEKDTRDEIYRCRNALDSWNFGIDGGFDIWDVENFVYDIIARTEVLDEHHENMPYKFAPKKFKLTTKSKTDLSAVVNNAFYLDDGFLILGTNNKDVVSTYNLNKIIKPLTIQESNPSIGIYTHFNISSEETFYEIIREINARIKFLGVDTNNKAFYETLIETKCEVKTEQNFPHEGGFKCIVPAQKLKFKNKPSGVSYFLFETYDKNSVLTRNFIPIEFSSTTEQEKKKNDFYISGMDIGERNVIVEIFNLGNTPKYNMTVSTFIPELALYSSSSINFIESLSSWYGFANLPLESLVGDVTIPEGIYDIFINAKDSEGNTTTLPSEIFIKNRGGGYDLRDPEFYKVNAQEVLPPKRIARKDVSKLNKTVIALEYTFDPNERNLIDVPFEGKNFKIYDVRPIILRKSCNKEDPNYLKKETKITSFMIDATCFAQDQYAEMNFEKAECCDAYGCYFKEGEEARDTKYKNCTYPDENGIFTLKKDKINFKVKLLNSFYSYFSKDFAIFTIEKIKK